MKKYKIDKNEFKKLYEIDKLSKTNIAKHFNISFSLVKVLINEFGCVKRKVCTKKVEEMEKVLELYNKGMINKDISKSLGYTIDFVKSVLKKSGLKSNYHAIKEIKIKGDKGFCERCEQWQDISNFRSYVSKRKKGVTIGKIKMCNSCRNKHYKKYIRSSKEKYIRYTTSRIKSDCKKRIIEFNLTPEYVLSLYNSQDGKCFYSGVELIYEYSEERTHQNTLSIDRVNPNLGYLKGNIVLCTKQMNTCKSNLTLDQIKEHMPFWYSKIKNCNWLVMINGISQDESLSKE